MPHCHDYNMIRPRRVTSQCLRWERAMSKSNCMEDWWYEEKGGQLSIRQKQVWSPVQAEISYQSRNHYLESPVFMKVFNKTLTTLKAITLYDQAWTNLGSATRSEQTTIGSYQLNSCTYLALPPGTPGAFPKCLTASLWLLHPWMRTQCWPLGDRRASWSNVMISPPASRMRDLARSVTLSAQI